MTVSVQIRYIHANQAVILQIQVGRCSILFDVFQRPEVSKEKSELMSDQTRNRDFCHYGMRSCDLWCTPQKTPKIPQWKISHFAAHYRGYNTSFTHS